MATHGKMNDKNDAHAIRHQKHEHQENHDHSATSPLNIANVLTVVRLIAVPFFVGFLLTDASRLGWGRWAAVVIFALAIYTDALDGRLARARGIVTAFGKLADPIADKFLIGSALVVLSCLGEAPWWFTGIVMLREIGITVLRFLVIRHGVIAASRGGKLKTGLQTVAVFLLLLPWTSSYAVLTVLAELVMVVTGLVTVWTGGQYVRDVLRAKKRRSALGHFER